jgi:lipid II:glycine glycyltransferase (peptidoglycan interpeptide bridge formation enzyme)
MSDLRQSNEYANYLRSIGWQVETHLPAGRKYPLHIYLKHFPILGWFAKIQRPDYLNNKVIDFIESTYHPHQFSIEPLNNKQILFLRKFKLSNSPSLPSKTLVIDLKKSEKELLNTFSQKTRYNINLANRKNIKIIEIDDILVFTNFWRNNFEKKRFPFFSQQKNIVALSKAFGKNSKVLLAKKDNKVIAVLFLLLHDKITYYMYAASNSEGRKNFAPTLLTWHAVLLSKKLGIKTFDFDGIYDERFPIKSWLGFTKFKKGFGGYEIGYPGMFVKKRF